MKSRIIVTVATLALASSMALFGCSSNSASSSSSAEDHANAKAAAASSSSAEAVSDYDVTIDGMTLGEDYQGNPAAIVTYTFTNNSEKDTSFAVAIDAEAYQNGVELDTCVISGSNGISDSMKNIKPGGTITVDLGYQLDDTTSPVTVECGELFSFNDEIIATETFDIA